MNFFIVTFGCKVNQYESEVMSELLQISGHTKASDHKDADFCIVNSCTVTAVGDSKCRKYIRAVKRANPDCVIVICGCMPQAFSDNDELYELCDIVLGNTSRCDIADIIDEYYRDRKKIVRVEPHDRHEAFEPMRLSSFDERTRAFVKIEDGCNRFCSYCIIPYARGRVRSKPIEDLLQEASELAANGYKELVLVGINLSAYGQELGLDIRDAVKAVCGIDGIERVRLGSIEPERMTREVLTALAAEPKFCPHFHLSLQAGCDATLKRMKRLYDTAEFERIVCDIRELFDNPAITTDVMVGFVGETDEDFEKSLDFCDKIGFARAHVFPYSIRRGTLAEKMDGHVDERIKHIRAEKMIARTSMKQREFMLSQVGRTASVLVERSFNGISEGYTPNYTRVRINDGSLKSGEIVQVRLTEAFDDHCSGELI